MSFIPEQCFIVLTSKSGPLIFSSSNGHTNNKLNGYTKKLKGDHELAPDGLVAESVGRLVCLRSWPGFMENCNFRQDGG
jgi:hypothetical protein